MSLPQFDVQGSLFESLGSIAPALFGDQDKYQLFAKKVWPVLARCREQLEECYTRDNGRPGVEPVVLLGVLIFQFLERVPDRQAVEMVKYHLGWKLALHLSLGDPGFHPTTLVYFRQRLLEHAKSDLACGAVLGCAATARADAQTLPPTARFQARREGSAVQSPHDPDAQYAAIGRGNQRKTWLGYKVQVAEALPEQSQPPFVVSIVTQKATGNDEPGLDQTLEAQAQSGLQRPRELYV